MTRTTVAHAGATFGLESLFVDYKTFVSDNSANFIFFLFTTHEEDLIMNLNRSEVFWKNLGVAQTDLSSCLRCQLVDQKLSV